MDGNPDTVGDSTLTSYLFRLTLSGDRFTEVICNEHLCTKKPVRRSTRIDPAVALRAD